MLIPYVQSNETLSLTINMNTIYPGIEETY